MAVTEYTVRCNCNTRFGTMELKATCPVCGGEVERNATTTVGMAESYGPEDTQQVALMA